jgi:hypothetical protein
MNMVFNTMLRKMKKITNFYKYRLANFYNYVIIFLIKGTLFYIKLHNSTKFDNQVVIKKS